jgi:hypothetical protein
MRTLALGTHPRLRYLITITRRDETVTRLTTDQRAIVLPDGTTWNTCPGLQIGDFTERNDGTLPSTSLSAFMEEDGAFDPYDVDNNLFEDALVEVDFIDRGAAASPDHRYFWFRGYLNGGTQYGLGREVQFDVLNAFATPRDIFVRQYNIPCDADFGDPLRCKIPTWPYSYTGNTDLHDVTTLEVIAVGDRRRHRFGSDNTPQDYHNVYLECTAITTGVTAGSAPAYDDTVGNTTTDGGVTWTTRNAYVRYVRVAALIDERTFTLNSTGDTRASAATWYVPGRLVMRSGYSKNRVAKISAWIPSSKQVTIVQPFAGLIAVNDWIEIAPDCDKSLTMCTDKYDNAFNYRGFDHLAGDKVVTSQIVDGVTNTGSLPTDDPGYNPDVGSTPTQSVGFRYNA